MTFDPPVQDDATRTLLRDAMAHHNAGRLDQAAAGYEAVLRTHPNHPDALHLSGLIANQQGDASRALDLIRQAIRINPDAPMFHNNLGNVLMEAGEFDAAGAAFARVLELKPDFAPAHFNLGNLHHRAGRTLDACESYRAALAADAGFVPAMIGLGHALIELGEYAHAQEQFRAALTQDPELAEAHAGIGDACARQRRFEDADASYRAALNIEPDNAAILVAFGQMLRESGDLDAAVANFSRARECDPACAGAHYALAEIDLHAGAFESAAAGFQRALAIAPDMAQAHYNLGATYRMQGRLEDALACLDRALVLQPDFIAARWLKMVAQIPIIHDSEAQIDARRAAYRRELEQLSSDLRLDTPKQIEAAAAAVGTVQPFYLAYQGRNDCDLQRRYGELVCRIQAAAYPALVCRPRTAQPQTPLRIGFVSGFFYQHSNWKMPLSGWIEQLDPSRFELYGYYTGPVARMDDVTASARRHLKAFVAHTDFHDMARAILDDAVDVLIYAEIGMDPLTLRLAGLRLAPIQCASWGHPDTSGMPSIDYYLSSELMEPADAHTHYSERLVRLPKLSIHYTPQLATARDYTRADFGLRADSMVYFCAQSLFKYLPQHDEVFARIAKQVPNCQFVFLDYPNSPWLTELFRHRIARAFAAHGLNSGDYVLICRHLTQDEYHGLNRVADVFLDSIGWSGCNSTMEAIAAGLPIASLAGDLMRGRHTLAMLTMIGMAELVAPDRDAYIALAVRLGTDGAWRDAVAQRLIANRERMYRDRDCIAGLERFLLQAAGVRQEEPQEVPAAEKSGWLRRLFGGKGRA